MKETRHHDDFAGEDRQPEPVRFHALQLDHGFYKCFVPETDGDGEDLSFFLRLGEDGAGEISMADGDLVAGVLLANRFAAAFITPHEVINDYGETTDQP